MIQLPHLSRCPIFRARIVKIGVEDVVIIEKMAARCQYQVSLLIEQFIVIADKLLFNLYLVGIQVSLMVMKDYIRKLS